MLQRLLSPIVEVRKEESWTAFLMFAYSCLAMTAYNIHQAAHAIEVHLEPRRRQPAVRAARRPG